MLSPYSGSSGKRSELPLSIHQKNNNRSLYFYTQPARKRRGLLAYTTSRKKDTVSAPLTSLNEPNTNKQTLKEEKCSSLLSNGAATLPTDSREGIRRFLPPSGNRKEDGPSKRHTNTSVNVLYILIAPVYRTKQSRDLPSQLKRKMFPT